jgi:hypothetical protein
MTREPSASARFHLEIDRLAAMPQERLTSAVLSELHLRSHKPQIYIDDDGLVGGDTHHHQLSRAFTGIGAPLRLERALYRLWGTLDEVLDPPGADVAR